MFNLVNCRLLDADQINVQIFRISIAICQLAGSVLCLTIVDYVERKVSMETMCNECVLKKNIEFGLKFE